MCCFVCLLLLVLYKLYCRVSPAMGEGIVTQESQTISFHKA